MRTVHTIHLMKLTPEEIAECDALKALFADRAGMSQAAAAAAWGLGSQSNLSHYLNKRQSITLDAATKFAKGLGVPIDDFSPRLARQARAISRAASSHETAAAMTHEADAADTRMLDRAFVIPLSQLEGGHGEDQFVAVESPADLLPFVFRGAIVIMDTHNKRPKAGSVVAVSLSGGGCALGHYRKTVSGFEVDCGRGAVLDNARHGLHVLGVAIEMRMPLSADS